MKPYRSVAAESDGNRIIRGRDTISTGLSAMEQDIGLKNSGGKLPLIIHPIHPKNELVHGMASEESDSDIVIISERFGEVPFLQRMPMMMKLVPFPKHIDYVGDTPQEFRKIKNASSILIDALSDPLELAAS
jgi:hypothetical protein